MERKKDVWEVGQKVFTARNGWGVIKEINSDYFPIIVKFDNDDREGESYTCDGREYFADKYPILSYTNYITDRFSQDPEDATYAQVEPDFDWGCLPERANNWIAKSKDDIWRSYYAKPIKLGSYFARDANNDTWHHIHPNYFPKNSDKIDWDKSLFKNPNK